MGDHDDGYTAALNGSGAGDCPWAPADPAGAEWRQGWIRGEADRRHLAGTFDHSADEYAAYRRSIGWTDDTVVYEPPATRYEPAFLEYPGNSAPALTVDITIDVAAVRQALQALADYAARVLEAFDVTSMLAFGVELADVAAAIANHVPGTFDIREYIHIAPINTPARSPPTNSI